LIGSTPMSTTAAFTGRKHALTIRGRIISQASASAQKAPIVLDHESAAIVERTLLHFDGQRYRLFAWCVMPNHVHVVAQLYAGCELSILIHSWKSYSAHEMNRLLDRTGPWQREYFDRIIRSERELLETVEYVLENPERAGLADWPFSGFRPWDER
jgi:REP element-mobilizing transposase RayT